MSNAGTIMTIGAFIFLLLLYLSSQDTKEAYATMTIVAQVAPRVINNGITHGVMVDENGQETASAEQMQHFNSLAGKKVGVVYFSDRWYSGIKFPAGISSQISAAGAIPSMRI
jgi:hypothetical protein